MALRDLRLAMLCWRKTPSSSATARQHQLFHRDGIDRHDHLVGEERAVIAEEPFPLQPGRGLHGVGREQPPVAPMAKPMRVPASSRRALRQIGPRARQDRRRPGVRARSRQKRGAARRSARARRRRRCQPRSGKGRGAPLDDDLLFLALRSASQPSTALGSSTRAERWRRSCSFS